MARSRSLLTALLLACALVPATRASADTLYVTDRAANVVHQFHIGSTGALTALNPPTVATAGVNPTGVAVSLNGRSVYVASSASGATWFGNISQYDVFESGALGAKRPFVAFAAADPNSVGAGVAVTGDSRFAYVTGCCSGSFGGAYQFGADASGLLSALTPPFVGNAGATDVVVHPTLPRLYVSRGNGNQITRWGIESDGTLRGFANTAATNATQLAITPNGRYLYATSSAQDVLAFAVDPGDGRLTSLGPVTIPSGTVNYVAASDSSVYVSTGVGISQYDVGGDGRLTPKTPADLTLRGAPAGIALSPDGRSAYVASYLNIGGGGSIVAQFDVGTGGVLTPKAAGPIVVRGTPTEIAVTTAGTGGGSTPPPGTQPPPPPAPPAPPTPPPARRIQINEILLYRREGGRFVGFKWDARGVKTEITCKLTRESPGLCDATVEIIDLFADNVRVVHFSATRGGRRARRPTVLARGRIRLAPGRTGTIQLRFTRAGRAAIRGRRSLNAVVLTRLTIGSEPPLVGQARAKLKPARARRAPRRRAGRR